MTTPRFLTIHCSAHPEGRAVTVAQMNAIAMQRFRQRSYHWIVTLDGVAHRNMEDNQRGAHVGGHNTGNIGIVYVGGIAADGKTCKDTRTPAQAETLRRLVAEYRARLPGIIVRGHRDWSPDRNGNGKVDRAEWLKCCPSFDVATELGVLPAVAAPPPPAVHLRAGPRALHLLRRYGHSDAQIAAIDPVVRKGIGNAPTTPGQFGALMSFALSIGAINFDRSQSRLDHVAGLHAQAAAAFGNWRKVRGVPNPALIERRAAERALYENRLADFDRMTGYRP